MDKLLQVDFGILDWIAAHMRTDVLDVVLPFLTHLSDHGEIWILLGFFLLLMPKERKLGLQIWLALLLSFLVCNLLLKDLIARPRPFMLREEIELIINAPSSFSFPSGHSSASFAAASVLLFHKRWPLAIPALILAALIAFSRLYLYVHFPTDVLAGILLGLLLGFLATKLYVIIETRLAQRRGGESG